MDKQTEDKLLAVALRRLEIIQKSEAFDPFNLESRPTAKQQQVIDDFGEFSQQWIRAGNQSGKSAVCAWIVKSVLTNSHPTWKRPESWGSEPLLVIVAGRTGKQIEDSLLPKIRGFLEPGTYKEVRVGNIIQRLELDNGNRVIFQSLENPNSARERLQSYVAHLTWCDELPPTMDLVRELLIRTQARNGFNLFSFTPTVVSIEIQKYVDSLREPDAKVYRFHMLDNPLYADPTRRQQLLDQYAYLPEDQKKMIFEGEWLSGDNQVYYFNYNTMVEMPPNYDPVSWRHVEAVDPALKSALGLTIWAENPLTNVWYCVRADYIKGIYVPTDLVREVKHRTSTYNIVRRIADPHEVWYIQTAASMGIQYMGVHRKTERKDELIKNLQQLLGRTVRLSPTCEYLIQELQECRWSDKTDGRIVNGSSYHLLDSAQYFCDSIPRAEKKIIYTHQDEWLYKANEERKVKREKEKRKIEVRTQMKIQRGKRW